jgi:hypothetical protein
VSLKDAQYNNPHLAGGEQVSPLVPDWSELEDRDDLEPADAGATNDCTD